MNPPRILLLLLSLCIGLPGAVQGQDAPASNPIEKAREAREAADANTRLQDPVLEAADSSAADPSAPSDAGAPASGGDVSSGETAPDPAPAPQPEAAPAPAEAPLETFDLDYTDTPVRTILRNVADAAELNVIIPDTLVGSISIQLKGVTWPQVFDIALEGTGFVWARGTGGIIRIQRVGADQSIEVADNGLVTVNFRNEPTRTAVQALAETVGLNIIIPADLDGTTSASLGNVAWERVLTAILEENDYQWFEDDGIIGIRQVDSRVVLDPQTGTLNINVSETPFQEVATLIGQTQTPVVNVVSPPEIENLPISLEVRGVTFDQALDLAILKLPKVALGQAEGGAQQFQTYSAYRQGPNLVQIVDGAFLANLRNEPPVVRIYDLRYASAGDILLRIMPSPDDTTETANGAIPSFRQSSDQVRPVVDGVQSVAADHANNLLIVTARPAALTEVAALIERLDQPVKQILIESKFVEITGQDQKNLGIDWASLRGWGVTAGPFTRNWSRSRSQNDSTTEDWSRSRSFSDVTTRTFDNDNIFGSQRASGNNNSLDTTVDNEATSSNTSTITNNNGLITTQDVSSSGNSSETNTENLTGSNSSFNQSTDILNSSQLDRTLTDSFQNSNSFSRTLQNVASTARSDTAIFSTDEFRLILRALEEESDAKLITNPNVVAINGKQARVELTDYFYKPGPAETSEGVTTRGEPQPLEPRPGTTLVVTPTVVGGQLISLNVVPQVNSVVGTQIIDGNEIPTVRRRATDSEVLLRSGSTLAIGGLITDENVVDANKVPILGDIPVLGRLFSSESTNVQTTNQIIFITASLLNPQSDTYMDVVGIERFNAMGLTDREVQGVGARQLTPEELDLQQAVRRARNEAAREELIQNLRIQQTANEAKAREARDGGGDAEEAEAPPDAEQLEEDESADRRSPRLFGPVSRR